MKFGAGESTRNAPRSLAGGGEAENPSRGRGPAALDFRADFQAQTTKIRFKEGLSSVILEKNHVKISKFGQVPWGGHPAVKVVCEAARGGECDLEFLHPGWMMAEAMDGFFSNCI